MVFLLSIWRLCEGAVATRRPHTPTVLKSHKGRNPLHQDLAIPGREPQAVRFGQESTELTHRAPDMDAARASNPCGELGTEVHQKSLDNAPFGRVQFLEGAVEFHPPGWRLADGRFPVNCEGNTRVETQRATASIAETAVFDDFVLFVALEFIEAFGVCHEVGTDFRRRLAEIVDFRVMAHPYIKRSGEKGSIAVLGCACHDSVSFRGRFVCGISVTDRATVSEVAATRKNVTSAEDQSDVSRRGV